MTVHHIDADNISIKEYKRLIAILKQRYPDSLILFYRASDSFDPKTLEYLAEYNIKHVPVDATYKQAVDLTIARNIGKLHNSKHFIFSHDKSFRVLSSSNVTVLEPRFTSLFSVEKKLISFFGSKRTTTLSLSVVGSYIQPRSVGYSSTEALVQSLKQFHSKNGIVYYTKGN